MDDIKIIEITANVIFYFCDQQLLSLLKALESSLLSLDNFNTNSIQHTTISPSSSPSSRSNNIYSPIIPRQSVNNLEKFKNSGHKTRIHVLSFEGKYNYVPVFEMNNTVLNY
jgi:hypothetical protein